jgi:uncharacterized protein with PIN domain
MKFLCDAMLAHIGKRLREAGYDTRIDRGLISDYELVLLALEESRWLLTCDHSIQEIRIARPVVIHRPSQKEEEWASYLGLLLGVNWLKDPFSRCLECNSPLDRPSPDSLEMVPESVKQEGLALLQCPECHKIFWEGSHVRSMRAQLERLESYSSAQKSSGGITPFL